MAEQKKDRVKNTESIDEFKRNPWGKTISVLGGVSLIFGVGFGIGQFSNKQDFKIEKMELKQECSERVQAAINECRQNQLQGYNQKIDDIRNVVNDLQKQQNEK